MSDKIIINTKNRQSQISKHIYGHFAEHLGRCIYGGFWVGKDSPIPNINGYRKDVVQAFKDIDIPNLRWPGGCFADEYHWKDGIGPKENRKKMINTHWGGLVEDNSFGTHEFMGLCQELGCKPYICGNVGSGTPQEMNEWIEYMTFDGESPMSRLREQNGHKEAWKLDFFGIGNENWGCGGNMRPEYYADLYRRFQTYVRQYGQNKIFKIAGGANVDDYNWTEVLMRNAHWLMDGLSLHYYTYEYRFEDKRSATQFDTEGYYRALKNAFRMDELVRRHSEIMDKYDPAKRIALVVDEWGSWYLPEPGTNPGFLYQQNTMRDAVIAGIHLNIFNNRSDRVRIANIAQAVNVLQAPVLTEGDKILLTPTWHIFHMFKGHQDAQLLESTFASESTGLYDQNILVPGLSVSASQKKDEKTGKTNYLATVVNTSCESSKEVEISFANMDGEIKNPIGSIIAAEKMTDFNTFDNPQKVIEKSLPVKVIDKETVSITMPACSVASVTFSL